MQKISRFFRPCCCNRSRGGRPSGPRLGSLPGVPPIRDPDDPPGLLPSGLVRTAGTTGFRAGPAAGFSLLVSAVGIIVAVPLAGSIASTAGLTSLRLPTRPPIARGPRYARVPRPGTPLVAAHTPWMRSRREGVTILLAPLPAHGCDRESPRQDRDWRHALPSAAAIAAVYTGLTRRPGSRAPRARA